MVGTRPVNSFLSLTAEHDFLGGARTLLAAETVALALPIYTVVQGNPDRTYGKVVRTSSTLHAHDERNEANAGDTVRLVESRPLSRSKRWRLVEILERAR